MRIDSTLMPAQKWVLYAFISMAYKTHLGLADGVLHDSTRKARAKRAECETRLAAALARQPAGLAAAKLYKDFS